MTMSSLAIIDKIYAASGLEDILIESETVASGSLNGVLSGRMYNRGIRSHKLLYEALGRMQVLEFMESLEEETRDDYVARLHGYITNFGKDRVITDELFDICEAFEEHKLQREAESPIYVLWNSYTTMVQLLLSFLRGTRESNWQLHLSSLKMML